MQKHVKLALRVEIITAVAALIAGIIASIVLAHAGDSIAHEFDDAAPAFDSFIWRILGTLLVIAFAVCLYAFRRWNRTIFGIAELAAGVFAVWNIVGELPERTNTGVLLTILTGSGFVIIRGCDNIQQGLEAKRLQPKAYL